ncbi:hypothetical protein E9531_08805 [Lampropedia puyangensis]|uniref:Uncharacterized protein n=1 Tax=Lampropedia puyangensis TaxID=1330072 RepID=A0A4S8F3U7_9BURK|nr:hypothetical protein [Lampropedia puyangensis]THU01461.1 hypothetical protein E9531_08805 [Lampropedia puyangensis]
MAAQTAFRAWLAFINLLVNIREIETKGLHVNRINSVLLHKPNPSRYPNPRRSYPMVAVWVSALGESTQCGCSNIERHELPFKGSRLAFFTERFERNSSSPPPAIYSGSHSNLSRYRLL